MEIVGDLAANTTHAIKTTTGLHQILTMMIVTFAPALPGMALDGTLSREQLLAALDCGERLTGDSAVGDSAREAIQTIMNHVHIALEVSG